MPIITIDKKEYDTDKMTANARNQLLSLQYTDQRIAQLQAELAMAQTARIAYGKALEDALSTYGFSAETAN